jgi:SAM-dependent methyltransferase
VLHLQCHIGTDTLSLARRGATVTGIDFSEDAVAQARALSTELGIDATFLASDVYTLPERLEGTFDLVYTSYGVLCWLGDLKRWAEVAAGYVQPGGRLIVIDSHPVGNAVADDGLGETHVTLDWPCLPSRAPIREDSPGSYADRGAQIEHRTRWAWAHGLGEIVQSVLDAGLTLERLDEYTEGYCPRHEGMVQAADRTWHYPQPHHGRIPQVFSLVARRQAER